MLASLNHPNIGRIHGLEESERHQGSRDGAGRGTNACGPNRTGPITLDEALPIAKQIAEALEAAHEQGVIHRDLKPANVKVRPDGMVKVLDFGLAKALEPATTRSTDVTASPTITSPAMMTGVGVILGTAAYMSPEQAKGRRRTSAATSGRSGACSTRCCPARAPSPARTSAIRWPRSCAVNPIGVCCQRRRPRRFGGVATLPRKGP